MGPLTLNVAANIGNTQQQGAKQASEVELDIDKWLNREIIACEFARDDEQCFDGSQYIVSLGTNDAYDFDDNGLYSSREDAKEKLIASLGKLKFNGAQPSGVHQQSSWGLASFAFGGSAGNQVICTTCKDFFILFSTFGYMYVIKQTGTRAQSYKVQIPEEVLRYLGIQAQVPQK